MIDYGWLCFHFPWNNTSVSLPNSFSIFCFRKSILPASPWTKTTFFGSAWNWDIDKDLLWLETYHFRGGGGAYCTCQGSNPSKPEFFRLSFCSCIICVSKCDDLLFIHFSFIPQLNYIKFIFHYFNFFTLFIYSSFTNLHNPRSPAEQEEFVMFKSNSNYVIL